MAITNIPLRLEIARAITSALKEIHPDNGYEFDLRDDTEGRTRVVRGRTQVGDDEPLPMVSILEPAAAVEQIQTMRQPDNPTRAGMWDLLIQGWVHDDPVNPTDAAYQLEAEVRRRLASEKKRQGARPGSTASYNFFGLGRKIISFTIGAPVVRPNEYISEQGVFYLILTLEIAEDMTEPLG